jgi:hypothetical protein
MSRAAETLNRACGIRGIIGVGSGELLGLFFTIAIMILSLPIYEFSELDLDRRSYDFHAMIRPELL